VGFEPTMWLSTIHFTRVVQSSAMRPRHLNWLGQLVSNQRPDPYQESALPLSYAPVENGTPGGTRTHEIPKGLPIINQLLYSSELQVH